MHFSLAITPYSSLDPPTYEQSRANSQQDQATPSSVLKWFKKSSARSNANKIGQNIGRATGYSHFQASCASPMRQTWTSTSPNADAPPAYTEVPVASVDSSHSMFDSGNRLLEDDKFTFLAKFDTVFLIDDSTSMTGENWLQTRAALAAIAPICTRYDSDGIDVHFLNAAGSPWLGVQSSESVKRLFDKQVPRGATPTGQRLHAILQKYIAQYQRLGESLKPLNIIVITDGEATDDVDAPLISAARKLDKMDAPPWQVGIQFFQVGDSVSAREYLKYLDDSLTDRHGREIRDMVDTVPWKGDQGSPLNGEGILKVVLGAVNRRLDRRGVQLHNIRL